ncbi:chemotaxis protein CheA [Neokomagataea thailandica]|uniref:chemotaxis protein CheA n=1 Tax=Neokomagataea thailandica TaxID=661190 RepID=UPI00082CBCE2|nr:ATP-binding protein [Neokomagataea thailandica]
MRVDLYRIDKLVDLMGEILILQEEIKNSLTFNKETNCLSKLEVITQELQENIISMRAHPIDLAFQRMRKVVREAARLSNKEVDLILEGEKTSIDRSILEAIIDPLTHMVRNSVDHGIENSEIRKLNFKPIKGKIYLRAFHISGRVIIEVEDDGCGLSKSKIIKKAKNNDIITDEKNLTEMDIYNLIFSSGFSTSEAVSNLSGRGVGMDIVKREIDKVGGKISISSEENKGTKFRLSLPLTLSVMEGILLRVNSKNFIIPISDVMETFDIDYSKIIKIKDEVSIYKYRNEYVSVFNIKHLFNEGNILPRVGVCVVSEYGLKYIIAVDEIVDKNRFVIKSIEKNYKNVGGFSSSTILGDGSVSLIVDVNFFAKKIENNSKLGEYCE